jgi:CRISPR/Cas system-associated exonuclease Cas4 (RecB family)
MDTIIQNIYNHYEESQSKYLGRRLGASMIGDDCNRKLWYIFRWSDQEPFTGSVLRLFETGHLEEPRMINDLNNVGIETYDIDPDTRGQISVTDDTGHFGGNLDAVARNFDSNNKWHVVEMKTHNDKSFNLLVKKGVKESKPLHYAQMTIYAYLIGFKDMYYLAKNKNNDKLYGERLNLNEKYALELLDKAKSIIFEETIPDRLNNNPKSMACKWCNFINICHNEKLPLKNCRTCLHSSPLVGGDWECELNKIQIKDKRNIEGCIDHLYLPHFFTYHSDISKLLDNGTIEYIRKDNQKKWRIVQGEVTHEDII